MRKYYNMLQELYCHRPNTLKKITLITLFAILKLIKLFAEIQYHPGIYNNLPYKEGTYQFSNWQDPLLQRKKLTTLYNSLLQ